MVARQRQWATPTVAPVWTDRMWEELWERTLAQSERHRLAMALLRREMPEDVLARRVVPELARRWRRSCVTYALGWGLFGSFWLVIGMHIVLFPNPDWTPEEASVVVPWWMSGLAALVIAISLALRWWIRDLAGPPPARR